ncbi:MAG: hypothetical protein JXA09_11825 [Anaerolineae bacterium]|nr:hypothetical protein [Anaerolineae bacterium]
MGPTRTQTGALRDLQYDYDPVGNMTSKAGLTYSYTCCATAHVHAVTALSDGSSYVYEREAAL